MALGKTINISFSLEASGELAPDLDWASDTGDPIVGYYLSPLPEPRLQIARSLTNSELFLSWNEGAVGMLLEHASSPNAANWQPVPGSQSTNRVVWTPGPGSDFFRLADR